MYIPAQFEEHQVDELHRIIRENSLGALIRHSAAGLEADHVPFLLDTTDSSGSVLLAHVARANELWRSVNDGDEALVIFRGAHGYISPNWYPGKQDTHRRVPTWNYEVVHAHGTIHIHDDEKFVRGIVAKLTRTHEATQPTPWKMGDAPPDYLASQLSNIVGLTINVTRLIGKRKLNQHHDARDREGAAQGLQEIGNAELAQAMRQAAPFKP